MLSSRLPTGTVCRDGSTRRTYPQETNDRPPSGHSHHSEATETADHSVESLRKQNEALRVQNARLRSQLHSARERRQAVVERYEHVVTDVENEVEPDCTRRQDAPRGRVASLVVRVGSVLLG